MVIGAILVGILTFVVVVLAVYLSENRVSSFDTDVYNTGVSIGIVIAILFAIEINLVVSIIKPSALDVYRGNTELEITSVNGTPTDTVVVFKNN